MLYEIVVCESDEADALRIMIDAESVEEARQIAEDTLPCFLKVLSVGQLVHSIGA